MTYKELNLFHKYIYNKVDYELFALALNSTVPYAMSGYIAEKWDQFQKHPLQFIASYDEKMFNFLYKLMQSEDYKG